MKEELILQKYTRALFEVADEQNALDQVYKGLQQIDSAFQAEEMLLNQERGKNWEYRVVASNKADDGPASNTVGVVL